MTRQVLNRGTIANDGTGDTLRSATLKIEQNFQEIYEKLGDGTNLMPLVDFDSDGISFEGTSLDDFETKLYAEDPTSDNLVRIPDYTGDLVMDSATQTLANKTILEPVLKRPKIWDADSAHYYEIIPGETGANRVVTLPLLTADDEITFNGTEQTLQLKTLQNPLLNNPVVGNAILDSNQAEILEFNSISGAINHVEINNATNGNNPTIQAIGGDTNVTLTLEGKGTGAVQVASKLVLGVQTITTTGTAVSASKPVTIFDGSTSMACNLDNGTQDGETKWLVNEGTATATVSDVSNNLKAYVSMTIPTETSVQLMWLASSVQWMVINNNGATLNT